MWTSKAFRLDATRNFFTFFRKYIREALRASHCAKTTFFARSATRRAHKLRRLLRTSRRRATRWNQRRTMRFCSATQTTQLHCHQSANAPSRTIRERHVSSCRFARIDAPATKPTQACFGSQRHNATTRRASGRGARIFEVHRCITRRRHEESSICRRKADFATAGPTTLSRSSHIACV